MPDKWYDDHDGWVEQFNNMLEEALGGGNPEHARELDDYDEMAMSDLAAKLAKGKISFHEALHKVMEWVAGRHGVKLYRTEEEFLMEMNYGGLIEITDEFKVNLLTAGEIGIADAVGRAFADPRILVAGPGDIADLANQPGIGMQTKAWFEAGHMNPTEIKNFMWAVETALKTKLSEG